MKNLKKLLVVLCICSLLFAGCAVAAFATDETDETVQYTGKLSRLFSKVYFAVQEDDINQLYERLVGTDKSIKEYLDKYPVDPASTYDYDMDGDGEKETYTYDDVMDMVYECTIKCINSYAGIVTSGSIKAAGAFNAYMTVLEAWEIFDIPTDTKGYDEALAACENLNIVCAELYVSEAEKASDDEAKQTTLDAAVAYLDEGYVDPEGEEYKGFVDRLAVVAFDCFKLHVEAACNPEATVDDVITSINKAQSVWNLFEIPSSIEGYEQSMIDFDTAVINCATLLVADIDADIEQTLDTASNIAAINRYRAFVNSGAELKSGNVEFEEQLAALQTEAEELVKAHEAAVEKNLAALDATNSITNYDLQTFFEETWQDSKAGFGSGALSKSWSVVLHGTQDQIGVGEEANGNRYFTHKYTDASASTGSPYAQLQTASLGIDASSGVVIEFDVTTFSNLPELGTHIETGSIDGVRFPKNYIHFSADGDIMTYDGVTLIENAIVKGEWLHIVIVFNPDDFKFHYYIEGKYLGSQDATIRNPDGETYDFAKVNFRISGAKGSSTGDISIDNLLIYGGNCYRDRDRFDHMTDDEKFLYYSDYLFTKDEDVFGQFKAYENLVPMVSTYWDKETDTFTEATNYSDYAGQIKAAIALYKDFDYDAFKVKVREVNLQEFVSMVVEVDAIERKLDNTAARQTLVDEIDKFVVKYGDELINKELDTDENGVSDYSEYNYIYSNIRQQITYDTYASEFITYMERFSKSTSLASLTRTYNNAKKLLDEDLIDLTLILDESTPDRKNFEKLISAYDAYVHAADEVRLATKHGNSQKIVNCIAFIDEYNTEEQWLANYDVMTQYLFIIKDYILEVDTDGSLLYDPDFEGVEEAVEYFDAAYEYIYGVLQQRHIESLSALLDAAVATEAYVEKMGIIAEIDRYIEKNDIDYTNKEILDILNKHDTLRSELMIREEDYGKLLRQNSVYFVNIVEKMRTAETYNEQKAYFEQAHLLYFNIDITVEGTANAVAIYEQYNEKLSRIEESSLDFIDAVALYKACTTEEEKYAALVVCYYNAQFVELSYDGAKEAMDYYQAEYDAYMGYVDAVNAEIAATGNAVGSFRANCGIKPVIAIIVKKIFGE